MQKDSLQSVEIRGGLWQDIQSLGQQVGGCERAIAGIWQGACLFAPHV